MSQQQKQTLLDIFTALTDETRLSMVGLLNGKEYDAGQLAEILQLNEPTISDHLSKLREVGLVNLRSKGNRRRFTLNGDRLKPWKAMVMDIENISQQAERTPRDELWIDDLPLDEFDRTVLKDNVSDGRLLNIPAKQKKLESVLRWMIMDFEPGVIYTEPQVNELLTYYNEDYATLRRALVDNGFLQRESSGRQYWLTPETEANH
jgi:hypothetical protein